ncbi:MAG: L-erythro-3,5-diaminohexanoate dehydrogenase [Actinobacteria bacterium]|nr:L-erythro-3,5-diaminohexanoate dehydrogenase [Actinomycetota bacterium]
MKKLVLPGGDPYGSHRVIAPEGALPQPALKLDNDMSRIWDNEILVDVELLNVDSASFSQIEDEAGGDRERIARAVMDIVEERGKLQNPVTGSGGMLVGTVAALGEALEDAELEVGERIASLVSLSLTPLRLEEVLEVRAEVGQLAVKGQAVIFASGVYARMPDDLPVTLALAVFDVCGAPAQVERLAGPGDTLVVLGATGKSGMLCCSAARRRVGGSGRVIGLGLLEDHCLRLEALGLCDAVLRADARDALACHREISRLTGGRLADLVVNCANLPGTEMASVLACREGGVVYFFNMATSFAAAALGAEGVGKDLTMIIGNGYVKGNAEYALGLLRESQPLRELYTSLYG